MYIYIYGWWFGPFWKILVSWDDYSQYIYIYMEKYIIFQTTNQYIYPLYYSKWLVSPWDRHIFVKVKFHGFSSENHRNGWSQLFRFPLSSSRSRSTLLCNSSAAASGDRDHGSHPNLWGSVYNTNTTKERCMNNIMNMSINIYILYVYIRKCVCRDK